MEGERPPLASGASGGHSWLLWRGLDGNTVGFDHDPGVNMIGYVTVTIPSSGGGNDRP